MLRHVCLLGCERSGGVIWLDLYLYVLRWPYAEQVLDDGVVKLWRAGEMRCCSSSVLQYPYPAHVSTALDRFIYLRHSLLELESDWRTRVLFLAKVGCVSGVGGVRRYGFSVQGSIPPSL
jgi:hypothetical protein